MIVRCSLFLIVDYYFVIFLLESSPKEEKGEPHKTANSILQVGKRI